MELSKDLSTLYEKCYDGYQKVDDFRFKLLGILPLASGLSILEFKTLNDTINNSNHIPVGLFGFIVSFGLLIYELKGIQKCTQFIYLGKWIETKMKGNSIGNIKTGYFTELLNGNKKVNEPIASAFIYSIVLALWTFVIFMYIPPVYSVTITISVFILTFYFVVQYWKRECIKKNENKYG